MRVVAYSIKNFEKEPLAKANQKKHDITLISNSLCLETAIYAAGKDAVIVFTNDNISAAVINKLADLGVKYVATRSVSTDHIDKEAAHRRNIQVANIPAFSPEAVAEFAVTLALALSRKIIPSLDQHKKQDYPVDPQMGFNFFRKTVGIIGLGNIGLATASIFKGFGCRILGYDISMPQDASNLEITNLETLLQESDIISLHIPLSPDTLHFINEATISKMKKGVMLLNTSRGSLINTRDILKALDSGKVGYLGLDVYEHEKGLYFSDHYLDGAKDTLLEKLMLYPNVIVTPHQASFTREVVQEIAIQTIENLDNWQKIKYADNAWAPEWK